MRIAIKIVCSHALWADMIARLQQLQEKLSTEISLPDQPNPYWKEDRLCMIECSAETQASLEQIEEQFQQLCGSNDYTVLTRNDAEFEIAVFRSIPELLSDPSSSFIECTAFTNVEAVDDSEE